MAKSVSCDVMVIGSGPGGALTALAIARAAPKLSVALLRLADGDGPHALAAGYTVMNPRGARLLPGGPAGLRKLTDGAVHGMVVLCGRDRPTVPPAGPLRAELTSRSISGYLFEGLKVLRGLLGMCKSAGVRQVRAEPSAKVSAGDDRVVAAWPGGQCVGRVAVFSELGREETAAAEAVGFRPLIRIARHVQCCGVTFASTASRINRLFGRSRPLVTLWQPTALAGASGHVWLAARRTSVTVGVMAESPAGAENGGGDRVAPATAVAQREQLLAAVLDELRALGVLPPELLEPAGPPSEWQLPLGAALELESHVGKRSLAVGLAGGFVSGLSGQWFYPTLVSATIAAEVIVKALGDPRPQDVLAQFGMRWRPKLADYLRSPNTQIPFLLPLMMSNRQIAARFCRAYLFGENF